ncbi:hypothetical protein ACU4GD_04345 [Cupriavidus basilensis]
MLNDEDALFSSGRRAGAGRPHRRQDQSSPPRPSGSALRAQARPWPGTPGLADHLDTFRIGAHRRQLRIYGWRSWACLCTRSKDAGRPALALAALTDKHLVIIDTVGMSQRDRNLSGADRHAGGRRRRCSASCCSTAPATATPSTKSCTPTATMPRPTAASTAVS